MNRMMHIIAAGVALSVAFLSGNSHGVTTRSWVGTGGDSLWSTPANWSGNAVPASASEVIAFSTTPAAGASRTVTFQSQVNYTRGSLHVKNCTEADPWVFEVEDDNWSYGITCTDDVWLGHGAAGYLWIKSGTYNFNKSCNVGANVSSGNYSGDKSPFLLKIGDGSSPVVLNVKGSCGPIMGSSSRLIADNAWLDFSDKDFLMYSTSSMALTNSHMFAYNFMTATNEGNKCPVNMSGGSLKITGDLYLSAGTSSSTTFTNTNVRLDTKSTKSFHVGHGGSSYAFVDKTGGDWSCGAFRLGFGSSASGTLIQHGGMIIANHQLVVGYGSSSTGRLEIDGGTVYSASTHNMTIGQSGTGDVIVSDSGVLNVTAGSLYVGNAGTATLTVKDGGVVGATAITHGSGTASGTITLDGGTLKARQAGTLVAASDYLAVNVAANGGTVDTAGYSTTIAEPFLEDSDSTGGGMTFKGGGTVTLASGNTYTGRTTVESGTTLVVAAPSELSGGIAVTLASAPSSDAITLITSTGDQFDSSIVTDADVPTGCTLSLSEDGLSVLLNYTTSDWEGDVSTDLCDAQNWSNDTLPTGLARIGVTSATTLTCSGDFSPLAIEFTSECAAVKVEGAGRVASVVSILNSSSSVQEIACPTTFAGTYQVYCADADATVKFSGGATATYPENAARTSSSTAATRTLDGTFNFTEDWIVNNAGDYPWIVPSGSVVTGKLFTGIQESQNRILRVEEGGSAYFTALTNGYNRGDIDVDGYLEVGGEIAVMSTTSAQNFGRSGNTGTIKAYRFVKSGGYKVQSLIPNIIVGAGGIGSVDKDYAWQFAVDTTITAASDFDCLGVYRASSPCDWGLHLSDKTVTFNVPNGKTVTNGVGLYESGVLKKSGAGTLVMTGVFNGVNGFTKNYTGGTVVEEGTLVVAQKNNLGTGAVTVSGGAVLKLMETNALGTVALNLADGAIVDISEMSDIWILSGTVAKSGDATSVTAALDVGDHTVNIGDCIVTWESGAGPDSSVNFTLLKNGAAAEDFGLVVKDTDEERGIFVKDAREPVFVKYVNGTWKYYVDEDTEYDGEWTAGVTSDMQVRFSTETELAAICATNFSPAAFVLTTDNFVNTLGVTNDFSNLPSLVFDAETVFDVNGGCIKLPTIAAGGSKSFTVTNSNEQIGTLEVEVASDTSMENTSMTLGGYLRLVKTGEGTFTATKTAQSYTGGTVVAAGTMKPGVSGADKPFGITGGQVLVKTGATLDMNGKANFYDYTIVLDGGELMSSSADLKVTTAQLKTVSLTSNSVFNVTTTSGFVGSGYAETSLELNGHALDVSISSGKTMILTNARSDGRGNLNLSGAGLLEVRNDKNGIGFVATNLDLRAECEIRAHGPMYVHDFVAADTKNGVNLGVNPLNVYGTFKPITQYFHGCNMQDGSTMDFSEWPGDWPVASAYTCNGNKTIEFTANTTVKVKIGEKKPTGSKILDWSSTPDVTFVRGDDGGIYSLVKRDDGLYCSFPMIIIIR